MMKNSTFLTIIAVLTAVASTLYDGDKSAFIGLASVVVSTGAVVCSSIEKKDK